MTDEDRKNYDRYIAAMHACQSAVAAEIAINGDAAAAASPKHLRVGINACLTDNRAFALLGIRKGLFTESEYYAALAEAAEEEKARMTKHLRDITKNPNLTFV